METDTGVCPLLGLVEEQGAYLTYPSYENRCYSSRAPQPIPLNEQTFFCLGGHMERCPRFQARQALLRASEQQDAAAPAAAPTPAADVAQDWSQPADAGAGQAAGADLDWPQDLAADEWQQGDSDLAPPPLPPAMLPAAASGRSRRPVWPLLLAAGTLVAVLMACGLASAGWLGWRALSTQLAVQPSGTPVVETGGTALPALVITGTSIPGGVVVVVATPTPNPLEATATADAAATATAIGGSVFDTATPTPTEFFFVETPPLDQPTATPTWTPFVVFETPTPRDTPTFFPTNTPAFFATPTNTWTPAPQATATSVTEPFFVSFVAAPLAIEYGQSSTLTWTVRGVRAIYLNGEAISGPTGTRVVRPLTTTTYVLRIIMPDNSVREETQTVTVSLPTPSATPTPTATPTATPYVNMVFAQDLSVTSINGQESSCRTGSGCTLFQVQVRNTGNRPAEYQLTKTETIPVGWGVFFCWGGDCEFGNAPPPRTLAAGARDTVSINYRVPSALSDGQTAVVNVTGVCPACFRPPFQNYTNTFTVLVVLPTPTPVPTGTHTPTPTITPTPTWTPTATWTPTVPAGS